MTHDAGQVETGDAPGIDERQVRPNPMPSVAPAPVEPEHGAEPALDLRWPSQAIAGAVTVSALPLILEGMVHAGQNRELNQLFLPATTLFCLFALCGVALAQIVEHGANRKYWFVPGAAVLGLGALAVTVADSGYPSRWGVAVFLIAIALAATSTYLAWCPYSLEQQGLSNRSAKGAS